MLGGCNNLPCGVNPTRVSILVLLDHAGRPLRLVERRATVLHVSILVLLDHAGRQMDEYASGHYWNGFRSLFSWIMLGGGFGDAATDTWTMFRSLFSWI